MKRLLSLGLSGALAALAPVQAWATGKGPVRVAPGKGPAAATGAAGVPAAVPRIAPLSSAAPSPANAPAAGPPKAGTTPVPDAAIALPAAVPAADPPAPAPTAGSPAARNKPKAENRAEPAGNGTARTVRESLERIGERMEKAGERTLGGYAAGRASFDLGRQAAGESKVGADLLAREAVRLPRLAAYQEPSRGPGKSLPGPEADSRPPAPGGFLARAEEGILMALSTIFPLIGTGLAYLAVGSSPLLYAGLLSLIWFGGSLAMVDVVADARSYIAAGGVHSHDQRYRVGMDGRLRDVRGHKAGVNDRWERREKGEVGRTARVLAAAASAGIGLYFAALSPAAAILFGILIAGLFGSQAALRRSARPLPPPPEEPSPR